MKKPLNSVIKLLLIISLISLLNGAKFRRLLQYDPYCNKFDIETGKCAACICRFYFDQNRQCKQVSDLCKTWNINDGKCTSCYLGYDLTKGICLVIPNFNVFDSSSSSIENHNCKTQDSTGKCLTCPQNYILHCGDCLATQNNPHCEQFTADNSACIQCKQGYQFDLNKICQQKKCSKFPGCSQCNQSQCITCQQGYYQQFYSKRCVIPSTYCKQGCSLCSQNQCFSCSQGYSAQGWPICQACSFMYARNSQGKCKAIQRNCAEYGNCNFCVNGECLMCQQGFELDQTYKCVPTYE